MNWTKVTIESNRKLLVREKAIQLAESGIDYYRWHLAHAQTDYQDGTNAAGPYVHHVYDKDGKVSDGYAKATIPSYKEIDDALGKIEVYTLGDALCDAKTKDTVFNDKILNTRYAYAGIFGNYVDEKSGELKEGFKIKTKVHSDTMPFWIAFGCYLMIGLGTLMGGWKIVKTMGTKITKVTPLEGVCAETAGALTLFTVSQFGIPVSTTHTITGSIIGVGATKRLSAVRWGVTINLLWAWILTIPVSAGLAAIFYYLIVWLR